jgi:hypothetical protein
MISQILTAAFTFAGSGLAVRIAARLRSESRKSRNWPTVSGKILERGVEPMQTGRQSFSPKVRYSYTVGGTEYAGQQVYRTGRAGSLKQSAQRLVDGLPESIPVHYNPDNPSEAFLLANPDRVFWIALAFGAGAFVWGLAQAAVIAAG